MKKGKSWKTTVAGVLTVAIPVAHILFPKIITTEVTTILTTAAIGGGFMAAKDGNVTGGNVINK